MFSCRNRHDGLHCIRKDNQRRVRSWRWPLQASLRWMLALSILFTALLGQQHSTHAQSNFSQRDESVRTNESILAALNVADTDLNDLAILSGDRVCAVGNNGTILLSSNGGRSWAPPAERVTNANLLAAGFSDEQVGLVVGGSIASYTRTSQATILRTTDGGSHWAEVASRLPRLLGVQVSGAYCLAWGDYSPELRSSVFESRDAGLTWTPVPVRLPHIRAASGDVPFGGAPTTATEKISLVAVGQSQVSSLASWQEVQPQRSVETTSHLPAGISKVHRVEAGWLAAGERGQVLFSADGREWHSVALPLATEVLACCRWDAIEQRGSRLWLAGSPGSFVLTSDDAGATWKKQWTGSPTPIRCLRFLDRNRGWAVGAMGKILATRDGGESWYPQRGGEHRAAVLAATSGSSVPWAPLVATAWEARQRVAWVDVRREELGTGPTSTFLPSSFLIGTARQLSDQAARLGLNVDHVAWQPEPQNTETGTHRRTRQLALQLQIWQPAVVLTDVSTGLQPVEAAWLQAIHLAGKPDAEQQQISAALGLPTWETQKWVTAEVELESSTAASSTATAHHFSANQYAEQNQRVLKGLGLAIWDVLLQLPPQERSPRAVTKMQTRWSQTPTKASASSLLGGVAVGQGSMRKITSQEIGNYQLLMGRIYRENTLQQLAASQKPLESWRTDFDFVASSLPEHEVEPVLVAWARELFDAQQWQRSEIVLESLIKTRPNSDAARASMLALLQTTASDEVRAWQTAARSSQSPLPIDQANSVAYASSQASGGQSPGEESWSGSPFDAINTPSPVVQASASRTAPTTGQLAGYDVFQSAVVPVSSEVLTGVQPFVQNSDDWFGRLDGFAKLAPSLTSRPDMQVLSYRMAPTRDSRASRLDALKNAPEFRDWFEVAHQELQFEANELGPLPAIAFAKREFERPQLDGRLDEPMWRAVPPIQLINVARPGIDAAALLGSNSEDSPVTQVHWGYGARFLYIAAECYKLQPTNAPFERRAQRVRSYDADLSQQDHLEFMLDTDRDYGAVIELGVSRGGETYDRCVGAKSYDPKWHVKVEEFEDRWVAELAIDLEHLTTDPKLAGKAWALSVTRRQPNAPVQSWARIPSAQPRPEASGLLLFLPGE